MQWIKQTFALRFNWDDGRTGHLWGDRYGSKILPGEPPEWADAYVFMAIDIPVRRIGGGGIGSGKRRSGDWGGRRGTQVP
jgi:hypothetical protein